MKNINFNSNSYNTYSWKLMIFDYCECITLYKLITDEVYNWTPNCQIYNMAMSKVQTLLNLAKQEIDKASIKLEKPNNSSIIIPSILIMNAAQYLRFSIEAIICQLVNNNIYTLNNDAKKISKTWRIKSIFKVLEDNKIDWSIKNKPIIKYSDKNLVFMNLTKNNKFNPELIIQHFDYLSDILHDKHLLHEKCRIIVTATFEEYKQKELDL